jgi:hypothetical protein
MNGTNYAKAQADSVVNAEVVGIVGLVQDANHFNLVPVGRVAGLSGLTAGSVYYLSPTTAGALTTTQPTTVGHVSKPLLVADSTTSGWFFNFRGMVIAAPVVVSRLFELVTDPTATLTTGDGKAYAAIPALLDGLVVLAAQAHVITPSSSGAITVQVANPVQSADILSTRITIDAGERDSKDAAVPPVIDAAHRTLANGDELRADVDAAGTGAKGLIVTLTLGAP